MPITDQHVEIERKPRLGGGGPGKITHRRGYGGGDDGDNERRRGDSTADRLRRCKLAVGLCIVSVTALFIGLTLVYVFRQGVARWDQDAHRYVRDWLPLTLPYFQLWTNTCLLLLSSVCLELARKSMKSKAEFFALGIVPPASGREVPWLGASILLGLAFLAGQIAVWLNLRHQGVFHATNPSFTFFLMLTGVHALHLTGGLLVLGYSSAGRLLRVSSQTQQIALEGTAWYWHFMGGLWLYVFALLYFVRG